MVSGLRVAFGENTEDSGELATPVGKSCHTPWVDADLRRNLRAELSLVFSFST